MLLRGQPRSVLGYHRGGGEIGKAPRGDVIEALGESVKKRSRKHVARAVGIDGARRGGRDPV